MKRAIFLITTFLIVVVLSPKAIAAPIIDDCARDSDCPANSRCLRDAGGSLKCTTPTTPTSPIQNIFGKIQAPIPIQQLGFGATGISTFLSNLVSLIYSLAIVVLIFMVLWGAWDWMTSEGDKEKLESAKRKLVNAFIGIILFAVAFAAIKILGTFTGFKFFVGQ